MKRLVLLLAFVLGLGVVTAQEKVTLTAPVQKAAIASWSVSRLSLDWEGSEIVIYLVAPTGDRREIHYTDQVARDLIVALNKANLSTRSLNQRIFDRLITDGYLTGTVGGTVQ